MGVWVIKSVKFKSNVRKNLGGRCLGLSKWTFPSCLSNREEEAKHVLKRLRKNAACSAEDIKDEFESIVKRKMSLEGPQGGNSIG